MQELSKEHIEALWNRFLRNELNQEELKNLLQINENAADFGAVWDELSTQIALEKAGNEGFMPMDEDRKQAMVQQLWHEQPAAGSAALKSPTRRVHLLRRWGWAAAAVFFLIATTLFLLKPSERSTGLNKATASIQPGREGAILTLADGSEVLLDNLGNGVIAKQNGTQVLMKNGQVTYNPGEATSGVVAYNTMTTPKGRQFSLLLPDSTQVWLNAASSIRYPIAFTGKERQVEVTGEAYFEVAKNPKMPFRVNVNGKADITVLGTHFNVNAYGNERSINTTLLEGSVKVSRQAGAGTDVVLKPGQQAQIAMPSDGQSPSSQPIKVIPYADVEKTIAWKNGQFNFENATLVEIMRQLERWYDIEVVYEQHVPDVELMGKLTRGVTLNELLPALKKMGLHYRLEGRKLTVLP